MVVFLDDASRLPRMKVDRALHACCPTVMQEILFAAQTPKRSSAEVPPGGLPLLKLVRQLVPHIMQQEVGIESCFNVIEGVDLFGAGVEVWDVAFGAAGLFKDRLAS